jgi:hypothetical protein
MLRNLWIRVAQLFGMAMRECEHPTQILWKILAVLTTVVAEEVLRRYFAPFIDTFLPGEAAPLCAAAALGILLFSRRRRA